MSVINILMQLRKVCNHPSLFDPRPIVSPFKTPGINYCVPSLVLNCLNYSPFQVIFSFMNPKEALSGNSTNIEKETFIRKLLFVANHFSHDFFFGS